MKNSKVKRLKIKDLRLWITVYLSRVNYLVFSFIFILSSFIFSLLSPVSAQNLNYKIPNPSRYDNLEEIISAIGSLLRPFFLITFGAMILFGAYLMLTSRGDEGKIENSKKTIMAAIIGFAIAALAPTVVNFVTSFLGVDGL